MNFAHDIFLNLNKNYYDFFEWNKKDLILHFKKIPLLKTNTKDIETIKNNDITLDANFIKTYFNKAEYYAKRNRENIVILSDNKTSIAVKFNNKGNIIAKSSLIIEDEELIFKKINKMTDEKIIYQTTEKSQDHFLTRYEQEKKFFLLKNLKKIDKNKLKYLYYDCFQKESNNDDETLNNILIEIKNNNLEIFNKCFNLIKLIYQQNK